MRANIACAMAIAVAACGGVESQNNGTGTASRADLLKQDVAASRRHFKTSPVCDLPSAREIARCHAHVVVDELGAPVATAATPAGFGPADLWSAYALSPGTGSSWNWNGQTVAIVDAYDNPSAEADLAVYRAQFGLPPCTTSNGCFTKVNQTGGRRMPRANAGWALESALDVQMVSAICPGCRILLVEASSSSFSNLATAVNQAAKMGANAISNSYGASEFGLEIFYESPYNQPGIAVTVSSGDSGYGVEFPASSRYVIAVGGTTLLRASNTRGWTETAWSGAGAGCSAYIPKPVWQTDVGCGRRMVSDVSAVADPNTGVAVYDSYGYNGQKGWFVVGGTSVSSPIIAAVYGLAGNAATFAQNYASSLYATGAAPGLFDIVSGSDGSCGSYLCNAVVGYDGPTGVGTPDGLGAF
jgi:subtilase family serine protease